MLRELAEWLKQMLMLSNSFSDNLPIFVKNDCPELLRHFRKTGVQ
jgi:hypothetical protein